jgi:hypothetical protein
MLQYSYTSDYFKERMKIFLGSDALADDEKLVRGVMGFIRGGFWRRTGQSEACRPVR